jgi:hypothetical protein
VCALRAYGVAGEAFPKEKGRIAPPLLHGRQRVYFLLLPSSFLLGLLLRLDPRALRHVGPFLHVGELEPAELLGRAALGVSP